MLESLSNKVTGRMPLCLKETPTKVFSCQYCEIFENSFFYKTPLAAVSVFGHYSHFIPLENARKSYSKFIKR